VIINAMPADIVEGESGDHLYVIPPAGSRSIAAAPRVACIF
jgi:hypothetical protein